MATGEIYSLPEITPTTRENVVFRSAVETRSSMKAASAHDLESSIQKLLDAEMKFMRLCEKTPDKLPPSFMAHHSASLSPLKGWETEDGKWEPKKMVAAGPGFGEIDLAAMQRVDEAWARTTLAFKSKKAGKKSDFGMTMYNGISWLDGKAHLEEDMTFCRVYRLPKKDISNTEKLAVSHWRSLFGHKQPLDLQDYFDMEANGVGGPKKRPRSKPIVGTLEKETPVGGTLEEEKPVDGTGSEVWHNFTKIYTKDPKVQYAACHHCGGMMKLTGGSGCGTSSPSNHYKTCKAKLRLTQTQAMAQLELVMLG